MAERLQSKRRRIMRDFKIHELSACDRPAQKHALAVLMKRADDEQQEHDMQVQKIGGDRVASFDSFEEAVEAIMKAEGCSRLAALERVDPGLIDDYNAAGEMIAKSIAEAAAPRPVAKAVEVFTKRIDEVMARDKVSKLLALEKATREFPQEFEAYQSA